MKLDTYTTIGRFTHPFTSQGKEQIMSINKQALDAIANEIIAMSEADQAMRKSEQWDASIDEKNTSRMKQIVADIG